MKRVKVLALVLTAALVAVVVMAASASALQWLLNGKALTSKVAVTSSGLLVLADLAATGGAVAIECEGTDKGTVGPTEHDETTAITEEHCEFEAGKNGACEAEGEVKATALNLPWLSLLLTVSGTTVDRLTSANGKGVGWSVSCKVAGILKVADECTSAAPESGVFDLAGGVELFSPESETASCTLGNRTSGMAIGADLIESPTGETLSVQCEELCKDGEWLGARDVGGEAKEEKGALCFFTAVRQRCQIQFVNNTGVEVEIVRGALMGRNRAMYRKIGEGCRARARLAARATCTDEVEIVNYVAGRIADYCLTFRQARVERISCVVLRT